MIEIGIYNNLSNDEYHADPAISRTGMMMFDQSPYKYWANYLNPSRPSKEMTPAMTFGKAFHEFILEPEEFKKHFAPEPPKVLLKNVGREQYEAYKKHCAELEATNKIILSDDEYLTLLKMRDALMNNSAAKELIEGAVYESSYFWKDEHSGLMLKARPDILHENMIVDLKTCADASPRAFQYAIADGGYHVQGAIIRDGVHELQGRLINNVINIAIEKKYPYSIGIYLIDEYALEAGQAKYKQICLDMKESINSQTFGDYGIQTLGLPKWAI